MKLSEPQKACLRAANYHGDLYLVSKFTTHYQTPDGSKFSGATVDSLHAARLLRKTRDKRGREITAAGQIAIRVAEFRISKEANPHG